MTFFVCWFVCKYLRNKIDLFYLFIFLMSWQALCLPSLLPTTLSPPTKFVKDELLSMVTAENLLKSTLLEDNGPQIYCGTALNFIKSVLDYSLLSQAKWKKSLAASTL